MCGRGVTETTVLSLITIAFYKVQDSNYFCWWVEALRKLQMWNSYFVSCRKTPKRVYETSRSTPTLWLSFITFVFLTAQASNVFECIEQLVRKPYISTLLFVSCWKVHVGRRVFEVKWVVINQLKIANAVYFLKYNPAHSGTGLYFELIV